ncbi:MAG: methylated-DNA--[protein]-cysteine S-methyltransferase [Chloroflexota bacterium]
MFQKIDLYTKNIDNVWFGVACDEEQVYATSFAKNEEAVLKSLEDCMPLNREWQVTSTPSGFAERALASVKSVYDGKGEIGNIALATDQLSPFYRHVLEVTRLIPVGYVTSYGALSEAAGGSPRAVGGVMAANPFAPIVPCHRVVKSDFTLGGYGGGLGLKTEMLTREKRCNNLPKEIPTGQKQLHVFPVERVLDKLQK